MGLGYPAMRRLLLFAAVLVVAVLAVAPAANAKKLVRLVSDPRLSHLDPIVGAPKRNTFLKTVVPYLKKIVAPPR